MEEAALDRRLALKVIGGAAILPALDGCTKGPNPGQAAWVNPGATETDPRRKAFATGILAPNPHNMQPWALDLSTLNEATLYTDPARLLPQTDPFNRQIVIGCGAMLELTRMAAARNGWRMEIEACPEGEPQPNLDARPLARMRFSPMEAQVDPLLAAVATRRTNRNAYKKTVVTPTIAAAITAAATRPGVEAQATVDAAHLPALRALSYQGAWIEAHTPSAHKESTDRTFFGDAEVAAHPWGISIQGPMIEAAHAVGLLTQKTAETPGSFAYNSEMSLMKDWANSAQGFVWLKTGTNTRADQLNAGAAYVRANLAATALGLAMNPWSQGLQEYATQKPVYDALHAALAPEGSRLQMFARIGYADPVPPAPRRGLAAQIVKG